MSNERMRRGILIRQARERAGFTQMDLSDALGFTSPQFVSNTERGLCDITFSKLPVLCRIIGIDKSLMIKSYLKEIEEDLEAVFKKSGRRK